jgi:hypothetical protein
MTDSSFNPGSERLVLKEPVGWFAAGDSFRRALNMLSDGAFKLFAFLCLEADRRSGRHQATQKQLAAALRKSKRIIGSYVTELQQKEICNVHPGKNQFASTVYEISDSYWPYHRSGSCQELLEQKSYVESVRECFLALGCTSGKFGAAETETAREMQRRSIPLAVIQDAMLLGASRKYNSWLNGEALEQIRSVAYFEPVIAEIQENPLPPGYSAYLRKKVRQLAGHWREPVKSRQTASKGGVQGMAAAEIVQ